MAGSSFTGRRTWGSKFLPYPVQQPESAKTAGAVSRGTGIIFSRALRCYSGTAPRTSLTGVSAAVPGPSACTGLDQRC